VKRLVWLYPRRWRDRYGGELVDLLAVSQHPWRDGVNAAGHAALVWSEVPVFKVMIVILAAASLVAFGFTVSQLADGVPEIPHHWWSSASAGLTVVAVAAAIVSIARTGPTGRA
jgi:hypothetical protein